MSENSNTLAPYFSRAKITRGGHTVVVGSGAAGLNAALQLGRRGLPVLIVTEGLKRGTSFNAGSDKQTYYKMGQCGSGRDSVVDMANALFSAGSMHGDLALTEAAGSLRAFYNLVSLGVPFPQDAYGQFPGYKTDHDPAQRATSTGPHMSREMCKALLREVERLKIPVYERHSVTDLLVSGKGSRRRVCGVLAVQAGVGWHAFQAENVIFATGGFGGLYSQSVYPPEQLGGIGIAMRAGARCQNLSECQFGIASVSPRWNVSGSYMQVVPRLYSTAADGVSDVRDFLVEAFPSFHDAYSMLFLKGYQWPFDVRRAIDGSSQIDLLIHRETMQDGRRVFLDYRKNAPDFEITALSEEASAYLTLSGATQSTPVARLLKMNPQAYDFYNRHGVDLAVQPLEIKVCAQHNNGGLAANHWWESVNLRHFFPVGEVNGSHGIGRPGGAALNAGQVGGIRAAEFISAVYAGETVTGREFKAALASVLKENRDFLERCSSSVWTWRDCRNEFRRRMSAAGAHLRSEEVLSTACNDALEQDRRLCLKGCRVVSPVDVVRAFENRQLCFAHYVYLSAQAFVVRSGAGSRGSSFVVDANGIFIPEDSAFRLFAHESHVRGGTRKIRHRWVACRPLPNVELWFEKAWAAFNRGDSFSRR